MLEKAGTGVCSEFQLMREHLMKLEERDKQEHYQRALQKEEEIATMLQVKYGVKKIYLYGSLTWGGFDRHSDNGRAHSFLSNKRNRGVRNGAV